MARTIKVHTEAGNVGADRVVAPPTAQDVLVGEASEQQLTNKSIIIDVQVLAATGSGQGDAAAITVDSMGLVHVTGADATKGVILPAAAAGKVVTIKNADAANAVLKVYPATDDAINAIAANSALSMAAKTCATFRAIDGTTWFTEPLLPS